MANPQPTTLQRPRGNPSVQFADYNETFVQRRPRYAVKPIRHGTWKTRKTPLSDMTVDAHLNGEYYVGVLGKWYPRYATFDCDDMPKGQVEDIRGALGLDASNSMLCTSESSDSYHLLISPRYNRKPPTLSLQNQILSPIAKANGIEIFPQPNQCIRLPFGDGQKPVGEEYALEDTWQEFLRDFHKLNPYDLRSIPHQIELDLQAPEKGGDHTYKSTYREGKELEKTGLLMFHSRHDSQFKVLYSLCRDNYPRDAAVRIVWEWIQRHHNGYSVDIVRNPRAVRKEIERQAVSIWGRFQLTQTYPDAPHNGHYGWITKPDIEEIMMLAGGRLPKVKFWFQLIKYTYPRRHRTFIDLHSDKLRAWSKRNYQEYLAELERAGLLKRYGSYCVDRCAKSVKIAWPFKTAAPILVENRAPSTLAETVRIAFKPQEFRELAVKAGYERTAALHLTQRLFGGVTNVDT